MIWQDLLFTVGGFVFIVALLPSVFSSNKPATKTSVVTGTVIIAYSVGFATLGLWLTFFTNMVTASLWFVLYFQVRRRNK